MEFKTILVHVDLSRHAPARIRLAASLAHSHGARLVGAAMTGIPRVVFPDGYDALPGTLSASYFEPLFDNARRALSQFEVLAAESGVPFEARLVCDQADDGLALMARFADLVVASQDDPDEAMTDMAMQVPEYVILNCARPVLVVPRADPAPPVGTRVLLAWDGSREASRAIASALPLLGKAAAVTLVTLAQSGAPGGRHAQADMLGYLAAHGVVATPIMREPSLAPGRDLLALAQGAGFDLLVMGCYGHTRWRELCLGGASRTVLAESRIALLMAH